MFLAFAYDTYYPDGGANDLVGVFATLDEARQAVYQARRDNGHVLSAVWPKPEVLWELVSAPGWEVERLTIRRP